jgi:hypothetical protein
VQEALIGEHAKQLKEFQVHHEFEVRLSHTKNIEAFEFLRKRVIAIRRTIDDEADLDNFNRRKVQSKAEFVLPILITGQGREDVPPVGMSRFYFVDSISRFRE